MSWYGTGILWRSAEGCGHFPVIDRRGHFYFKTELYSETDTMNSDEEYLVVGAIVVEKEEARKRKKLINYSIPIPLIEKD